MDHQMVQCRLAHAIGAEPPVDIAGGDRGDADERTAAAPNHLPRGMFEQVHGAVDIEVDGPPPSAVVVEPLNEIDDVLEEGSVFLPAVRIKQKMDALVA